MKEDYDYILSYPSIPWGKLADKTILITGGTGLIGSTMIKALLYANQVIGSRIRIIALVRDIHKARLMFGDKPGELEFIEGKVEDKFCTGEHIDYIIHTASPTASKFFIENPVDTIKAGVEGTINLLDWAVHSHIAGFLYLSSMEVYGENHTDHALREDEPGYLNPVTVRNCYPECKRMCEALCSAYARQYGIRTLAIRLGQTFGPGISYDDNRVFAMMARCAITGKDIELQTRGTSKHVYLYTSQAVTAILTVLIKGEAGNVYNAANPDTYCSIYEMGQLVAQKITSNKIKVKILENGDTAKYPAPSNWNLDITKIKALGWTPDGDLLYMFQRMMSAMI